MIEERIEKIKEIVKEYYKHNAKDEFEAILVLKKLSKYVDEFFIYNEDIFMKVNNIYLVAYEYVDEHEINCDINKIDEETYYKFQLLYEKYYDLDEEY